MRLRHLFGREAAATDEDGEEAPDGKEEVGTTGRSGEAGTGEEVSDEGDPEEVVADEDASDDATDETDQGATEQDARKGDDPDGDGTEDDGTVEDAQDVDEDEDGSGGDGDDGGFREVEFELSEWGARERKLLDEILNGVRVRRVWQAGTLVVSANDAEVVDDLIDEIEDRIALDLAPGVDPIIYDVRDWPSGLEDRFVEALIEGRVPHMRGYQEITVGVDDEERVDALVEEVTTAWEDEQPSEDELDGPDAQEVLSELFVTADRLLHDASDKTATVRFDDAAASAADLALPFGFAEGDWSAIKETIGDLRDRLGDAEATDTEIEEAASALRARLRPLV